MGRSAVIEELDNQRYVAWGIFRQTSSGPAADRPTEETARIMSPISLRPNPERSRFEVLDGEIVIGQAAYLDHDAESQRIFYHTVIENDFAGRGLAGRLAAQALDETVSAGLGIVAVCPFIKKYLEKHPQYSASVTKPTPAILKFLSASLPQASQAVR